MRRSWASCDFVAMAKTNAIPLPRLSWRCSLGRRSWGTPRPKGAHGIERGCREWKKRRYEGASGAPRLHFSWVNALARSEKKFADAEPRPTPPPRKRKICDKKSADLGVSPRAKHTALSPRALRFNTSEKTRLLISDVFASLFGIFHLCEKRKLPWRGALQGGDPK